MRREIPRYRDEYCQELIDYCAKGFSPAAFAGLIRVSRNLLMNWANAHPEFAEAMLIAKASRAGWLEEQSRNILLNGGTGGQASLLISLLKSAMPEDYKDRYEITGAEGKSLLEDPDPKRLAASIMEILKADGESRRPVIAEGKPKVPE